jgi:ABC-2 type transport system permease protein
MIKLGRIAGIVGLVSLLSAPLTLFLWDWQLTWVAVAKLIFGLLLIAFWLSTNFRGIRERFQGRSVFYGGFTVLFAVMALVAVVIVNYAAHRYPWSRDLTEKKIYSLSDQTTKVLEELEDDVEVTAFYGPKEREHGLLLNFFGLYRYGSSHFHYEFIDPVVRQDLVEQHKIHQNGPRIIVRYQRKEERVKLGEQGQSGPEEALTTALVKITASGEKKKICFTTGHGEKALEGEDPRGILALLKQDLLSEGYLTDEFSLLERPQVPPACEVVVLAGPRRDLVEDEISSLDNFLQSGGRLMAFLGMGDSLSTAELVKEYGIVVGSNTVIYPQSRRPLEVVTDPLRYPKTHPVFSRFFKGGVVLLNQLQAVFPMARSVKKSPGPPQGIEVTELAASSAHAWAETDAIAEGEKISVAFDQAKDTPGPVPLAAVAEAKPAGARLAVFGSSLLAVDAAYRVFPFNRNLVLNTLAWLTSEEKKIVIRPRFRAASLLRLDQSQMKFITFFTTDILPLFILAFGITIWQLRRWS